MAVTYMDNMLFYQFLDKLRISQDGCRNNKRLVWSIYQSMIKTVHDISDGSILTN